MSEQDLSQLVDQTERIGVIGSPSSTTELALDILASAVNKKLVGELALFRYLQDDFDHYALGQITSVSLRNIWHEDPTMRSLIRQRGKIDAVSERQDTHQGEMNISAVFSDENGNYRPSSLGTVPATGTSTHLVDDSVLDVILEPYLDQIFYLGHVYGSKPKLPLWFKHFDTGVDGAGEAYHLGIFGKTGSGKSVLAKMILLAYARHRKMGLFILDPQGEFSMGLSDNRSDDYSMGQILSPNALQRFSRPFEVFDLFRFRLDSWELFGELLSEFGFFRDLGYRSGNYQTEAAEYVVDFLSGSKHKLEALDDEAFVDTLNHLSSNVNRIYADGKGQERVKGFISEAKQSLRNRKDSPAKSRWNQTLEFFLKRDSNSNKPDKVTIWGIISKALNQHGSRPLVVVDLSKKPHDISDSIWNEKIKPLLIDRFLSDLIRNAEKAYQGNQSLNTLVVLDEAQRLAPRGRIESDRMNQIRTRLIDAAKTTRKYGLGWMFISQTLSSLDHDIIDSGLRVFFFGFGLGMGTEFRSLRDLVGGQGKTLDLYQRFRDPQSSFDIASREYSFMTIGPVSPLSFAGTPLFLSAFNTPGSFLYANDIAGNDSVKTS